MTSWTILGPAHRGAGKDESKLLSFFEMVREEAMTKALDYIKAALQIAFSLVVLAIILLNFQDLYLATRKFLERAASVSAIKALGVEDRFGRGRRGQGAFPAKRGTRQEEPGPTDDPKSRI